jgi:fructokinase
MAHPASGAPVVVVGEALVDVVVPHDSGPDDPAVAESVGGSPMNVAVGLARLDVPALLLTRLGDDARGERVAAHVRSSGAVLAERSVVPGAVTSTATAVLDESSAATYTFDLVWDLPEQRLPQARGLHVGSLGTALEPGRTTVLDLVHQAVDRDLFVSYDPNVRPALMGGPERAWRDVVGFAALSNLVKLSDEDASALRPDLSPEEVAAELLRGGSTELVLLTLGGRGAASFGTAARAAAGPPAQIRTGPVSVVDTVGAGDSFMAAVLASLVIRGLAAPGSLRDLDGATQASLLADAVAAAAVTVSRRGANPPTRSELPPGWPDAAPG